MQYRLALLLLIGMYLKCIPTNAQSKAINTAILNFGSNTCGDKTNASFSLIANPQTSPYLMASCNVNPPFNDVFSKFIAYNPKDNKVYINDVKSGDSRLYIYDMGLPTNYICPSIMPLTPTYQYLYIPNNFEFDINGDVWSIRDLVDSSAFIERIDEATGTILFSKKINFPSAYIPNTLGSGDIVIIPNGRMFIVMGDSPGLFFEITNYNSAIGSATANYIAAMPKPCFGILYMNGTIELTGTNFSANCYRYVYDLQTRVLSSEQPFQLNQTPVDNSSISPATGLSKKLLGTANIDSVTEDITYEIYARNMGNVKLFDFNVLENLGVVFGASNVSNVFVSIIAGANPSNLILNSAYDGVTDDRIFAPNQTLTNLQNGYVGFRVSLRATNLIPNTIYWNTAKSRGEMGTPGNRLIVIDSSNNGPIAVIDPNGDGDPGDFNENKPTPYYFGNILSVKFLEIKATKNNESSNSIYWSIAPPPTPIENFILETYIGNEAWKPLATINNITGKYDYLYQHLTQIKNDIRYRVKAIDKTGNAFFSKEVIVKQLSDERVRISPNPADDYINIHNPEISYSNKRRIQLIDATGKRVIDLPYIKQSIKLQTQNLPNGFYIINITDNEILDYSTKLIIQHNKR